MSPTHPTSAPVSLQLPSGLAELFARAGVVVTFNAAPGVDLAAVQDAIDHEERLARAGAEAIEILFPDGDLDHAGGATEIGDLANLLHRLNLAPKAST